MDIRDFLHHKHMKSRDMSKAIGCSEQYLSQLKRKQARPSYRLAKDISRFTDGLITIDSLMSLPTQRVVAQQRATQ